MSLSHPPVINVTVGTGLVVAQAITGESTAGMPVRSRSGSISRRCQRVVQMARRAATAARSSRSTVTPVQSAYGYPHTGGLASEEPFVSWVLLGVALRYLVKVVGKLP